MKTEILNNANVLQPLMVMWEMEADTSFDIDTDLEIAIANLQKMIEDPDSDVIGLRNETGRIVGYIGVVCFGNPVGKGLCANEHLWYVDPDFRGSTGSLRLIGDAIEWAKQRGCSHIIFNASQMASSQHERVCKLYERFGFRHFETSFITRIEA